jgi:G-rich domain on putative tyrosine kinase
MQLELNKVDVEIAALRQELAHHQTTVADLRQRLNTAPQVEAEYQQLNRDYDVNKAQYTALLESYQKARLGERADSAGSVRFEIVLPPTAPVMAVWPKRYKLLAGIFVGALAIGAAVAYALQMAKPVVESVRAINETTPFPVLGVVTVAFPTFRRGLSRRQILRFCAAAACLLIAFGVALVLNWSGARLGSHSSQTLVKS